MTKELRGYENALSAHYSNVKINTTPLMSWDIYGSYFTKLNGLKSDLKVLKKLSQNWKDSRNYFSALVQEQKVVVVTDTNLKMVFVSANMTEMNGYFPDDVIGHTPKIFQGEKTSSKVISSIKQAIELEEPFEVEILNYRKDNSVYHCRIKGYPLFDLNNRLVNYIAFEQAA